MGEFLKLNFLKFLILKNDYNTAFKSCKEILKNKRISIESRSKVYRLLASFLDEINIMEYKCLYLLVQDEKITNPELEESKNFLIFLFFFNFQLHMNHQYIDINRDQESYKVEVIRCYEKLADYSLNEMEEVDLRFYYFLLRVSDKDYKSALEICESLFDEFLKRLDSERKNILQLYKGVCYLGLKNEELALKILKSLESVFDEKQKKDYYHLNTLYGGLGDIYKKREDNKTAIYYYNKGIEVVKNIDLKEHREEMIEDFANRIKSLKS